MQLVLEGKSRALIEEVLRLSSSVGLLVTFEDIGLSDLQRPTLDSIVARATAEGETIHNEPFAVRPEMVADGMPAADAIGRRWKDTPEARAAKTAG